MTRDQRMNIERCKNDTQRGHIRNIEKWGVSIISVAPKTGDDGPNWTYSIGFWQQYQHPEVIIIGLDGRTAGALINELNHRIRDSKQHFEDGALSEDLLTGGYTCYFQSVEN